MRGELKNVNRKVNKINLVRTTFLQYLFYILERNIQIYGLHITIRTIASK